MDHPLYENRFQIRFNDPADPYFHQFDYDERSYNINMEFQHFHPFYEMFILYGDGAAHIIEGQLYDLQPMDIVCLRPAVLHKTRYSVGAPQKRLIVSFSMPQHLGAFQPEIQQALSIFSERIPIYRFEKHHRQPLFDLLDEIFSQNREQAELGPLITHCKWVEFLCMLYNIRQNNIYTVHPPDNATTNKMFDVSAYIHEHFSEPLSLQKLASHFYISTYYLSHRFKQVTGFTVVEYIQRTRVHNAQQSLMFSDKKINSIASECGFSSFSQFNRAFRKFCGMSPSEYKKQMQPQC